MPAEDLYTTTGEGNAPDAGGLTRLAAGSGMVMMGRDDVGESKMADGFVALYIFMLAGFIGFEVIRRVSPLLHTPLMSLTNALDAIAVVGAIVLVGEHKSTFSTVLGTIAVVAATSNIVGGFIITDRMLRMFKKKGGGR